MSEIEKYKELHAEAMELNKITLNKIKSLEDSISQITMKIVKCSEDISQVSKDKEQLVKKGNNPNRRIKTKTTKHYNASHAA